MLIIEQIIENVPASKKNKEAFILEYSVAMQRNSYSELLSEWAF